MKILIIQQKMIGDVLTSSILFEALKEKYPNAELHYLINSHTFPVVENNPFIDEYIFFTPEIEKSKLKLFNFTKSIRKKKYDVVIDVYSKLSSNLITLFSKAKTKISYQKKFRNFIYSDNIKREKNYDNSTGLEITNRLSLLKPLEIDIKSIKPKIYLSDKEIEDSKLLLKQKNIDLSKPLFMISVLGSSENKTYPLPYMAKIIDKIAEDTNGQILFNYIPNQTNEAKTVYNFCNDKTKKQIHFEVFGKSLREFLAITKHCNALIGNEGGAINMAKALNIPTFSIFSPWVDKAGWNMFEDDKYNVSIHLKDIKPELYNDELLKKTKNRAHLFYEKFLPEFIIPELETYLKNL
ncbi:glycosyltransferase family 9 protein [Flaviramulus sp. BrNp1-15]|uniref:glycosyltransferase family 9 protein n=1 Tax=Flaviramulus sp. BrNp1-15 TaxID=2916754 RepID=UPI001EE80E8F|nr:glycosyltransferase family 9 protein [Flaviramulus sp. BrNp1-15]ULC58699.1 glycosyltransferase family 9 protein [Flaviramulus sp. BrNp1-15]